MEEDKVKAWGALSELLKMDIEGLKGKGWNDDQVSKLASDGYITLQDLQGARREGLREAGIRSALIDGIFNARAAQPPSPPPPLPAGAMPSSESNTHAQRVAAQFGKLKAGLEKYCKALLDTTLNRHTKFLMLPPLPKILPKPLRRSIYIRQLYWAVLDKIHTSSRSTANVVTGIPGSGKSAIASMVIRDLAEKRWTVVYAYKHDSLGRILCKLDFTDSSSPQVDVAEDTSIMRMEWADGDNILLILDGRAPSAQYTGTFRTLVLSSPTVDRWSEYRKGSSTDEDCDVNILYMDIWQYYEIEITRANLYKHLSKAFVADRFLSFGGCVRAVLSDLQLTWEEVSLQFGKEHIQHLGNLDLLGFRSNVSHHLVHIRAGPDLKLKYYQLASHRVTKLVLQLLSTHHQHKVRELLLGAAGQTSMGGWCGMLFEQHGHAVIIHGINIYQRQLTQPTNKRSMSSADDRRVRSRPAAAGNDDIDDMAIDDDNSDDTAEEEEEEEVAAMEQAYDTHHYTQQLISKEQERADGPSQQQELLATSPACLPNGASQQLPRANVQATDIQHMNQSVPSCTGDMSQMLQHMQLAEPSGELLSIPVLLNLWDVPGLDISPQSSLPDYYLRPVSTNNPAWDGLICIHKDGKRNIYILQYTLNPDHGVRAQPIAKLMRRLKLTEQDSVKMVFVVADLPHQLYEDYKYQPWLRPRGRRYVRVPKAVSQLEQWVFRLPFNPDVKKYVSPTGSRGQSGGGAAAGAVDN